MKTMNRNFLTAFFALLISGMSAFGQVGVNTSTPHPSAALDIYSPNPSDQRGVLLPRMSTTERNNIVSPAQGLMVLDTTDHLFYYYNGARWCGLVPKQDVVNYTNNPQVKGVIAIDSGSVVTPHAQVVKANIDTAAINVNQVNKLMVPGFSTNALVPTGAILMWSGSPTAIPTGWALCDGNEYWSNGVLYDPFGLDYGIPRLVTPNLMGRFIVGYDSGTATGPAVAPADGTTLNYKTVGNRGGETGHLLTSAESGLPAHTHTTNPHNHGYLDNTSTNDANRGTLSGGAADANEYDLSRTTNSTTVTVNAATTQDAAVVHENRPPYFVLAYIIKLP